jgi:glycosyltransferase involved in cell wall biosynthesis
VVATSAGGPAFVIEDGVSGLLTPPDNAEALTNQLERLLADDQLRAQLGAAAADRAQRFGWPSVACDILRVYRETLEQSTLSRSVALLPRAEAC